ncbi:hypothetical protein [Thiorhodovibrio frisius]|uniref:Uncharacterized protein n=1 Tax=Thiorhodovibrio frisius TaxID=631362 RepID=H8YY56_9GAMM|nr:hypothetical protein [Thiorhodovibrio frisius]EIC23382.1 hypothetical protein Thi970DRAFT_01044 [Thiorhodovibrio frisius]WPL23537.1 hypothetical protein Thiofri_03727 [Thiorhodovibrio frisius]
MRFFVKAPVQFPLVLLCLWLPISLIGVDAVAAEPAELSQGQPHTPVPGTAEHRAILDALRDEEPRWL